MLVRLPLLLFILLRAYCGFSQTIYGNLKSSSEESPLIVNFYFLEKSTGKIKDFYTARADNYSIKLKNQYDTLLIRASSLGYTVSETILYGPNVNQAYKVDIVLEREPNFELKELVIRGKKNGIEEKGDTLVYNVNSFKTGQERKIEDIIRKLPGIEVNDKTGQIKYKGKAIETVNLDGDNLFGQNYTVGTRNINVDAVEKVEAIDNYSENPLLKEIESTEKVALNLVLKKGKYDFSGNIDTALGSFSTFKPAALLNSTLLGVNSRLKLFGIASYNNLGVDFSPFNQYNGSQTSDDLKDKAHKLISGNTTSGAFSELRTNFNNQKFGNINSLVKITKKSSIKVNGFLVNDLTASENSISNLYNFQDTQFLTNDESRSTRKSNILRTDIEYKNHLSKRAFLESSLKLMVGKAFINDKTLMNNDSKKHLEIDENESHYVWKGIYSHKLKGKSAFQISSTASYSSTPQSLIFRTNEEADSLKQFSRFINKAILSEMRFLGSKNRILWELNLTHTLKHIQYNSLLENIFLTKNFDVKKINKQSLHGELSWFNERLRFRLSGTLSALQQSLSGDTLLSSANILFEPLFSVKFRWNRTLNIVINASQNINNPSEEYIFSNPVIVSNRQTISNQPGLNLIRNQKIGISINKFDLYSQFRLSGNIMYQRSTGAFQGDYQINEDYVLTQYYFSSRQNNSINSNFNIEKFITLFSSNVKAEFSYYYNEYENRLNNNSENRNNINKIFGNSISWRTSFERTINFENSFKFNYNQSLNRESAPLVNKSWVYTFTLFWSPKQIPLNTSLKSGVFNPNLNGNSKNLWFIDLEGRYPFKSNIEINFTFSNILNQKEYKIVNPSDYGYHTFSYLVIPSSLILGVSVKI